MADQNSQTTQEAINTGKKVVEELLKLNEKNKKVAKDTAQKATKPVVNETKKKAIGTVKDSKLGKSVNKIVDKAKDAVKKTGKKVTKKIKAETKKQ